MKAAWLNHNGNSRLLIFFSGWGMNDAPVRHLSAGCRDVLVFYDFRNLDIVPFLTEIAKFQDIALVAWSLGCAAANRTALQCRWSLSAALAVNGTLTPDNDLTGIPSRWIAATVRNLPSGGWGKFIARMCPDKNLRPLFSDAPPDRSLAQSAEELLTLQQLAPPQDCIFNSALISTADRIILPDNQRRGWESYNVPTHAIAAPHYPFTLWTEWEDLLNAGNDN